MSENSEVSDKTFWKMMLRKYKTLLIVSIVVGLILLIGAFFVLYGFIELSPIGLNGEATFDQWTLKGVVVFSIQIILWELLIIGVPACLFFGVGGYLWWRRLPEEEKQEFKNRDKKEKHHRKAKYAGGGGSGLLMFIAYCIYIAVNGNYNAQFGTQPYSYWVYSYLLTLMWIMIVLGIPAGIICLILYFTKWRKK